MLCRLFFGVVVRVVTEQIMNPELDKVGVFKIAFVSLAAFQVWQLFLRWLVRYLEHELQGP